MSAPIPEMGTAGPGRRPCIAVIGASQCSPEEARVAEEVGRRVAQLPADLVCGGLGGVMEAAARGARQAGGRTIGILPGIQKEAANPFIDIIIPTGMGQARNVLVVLTADVVVAVGGEFGTLSEISLALKHGIPVVGLDTWPVDAMPAARGAPFYRARDLGDAFGRIRQLLAVRTERAVRGAEAAI
ncbi:MAG TPA: TIGR00725 family protein [Limnochordales bacterium]